MLSCFSVAVVTSLSAEGAWRIDKDGDEDFICDDAAAHAAALHGLDFIGF